MFQLLIADATDPTAVDPSEFKLIWPIMATLLVIWAYRLISPKFSKREQIRAIISNDPELLREVLKEVLPAHIENLLSQDSNEIQRTRDAIDIGSARVVSSTLRESGFSIDVEGLVANRIRLTHELPDSEIGKTLDHGIAAVIRENFEAKIHDKQVREGTTILVGLAMNSMSPHMEVVLEETGQILSQLSSAEYEEIVLSHVIARLDRRWEDECEKLNDIYDTALDSELPKRMGQIIRTSVKLRPRILEIAEARLLERLGESEDELAESLDNVLADFVQAATWFEAAEPALTSQMVDCSAVILSKEIRDPSSVIYYTTLHQLEAWTESLFAEGTGSFDVDLKQAIAAQVLNVVPGVFHDLVSDSDSTLSETVRYGITNTSSSLMRSELVRSCVTDCLSDHAHERLAERLKKRSDNLTEFVETQLDILVFQAFTHNSPEFTSAMTQAITDEVTGNLSNTLERMMRDSESAPSIAVESVVSDWCYQHAPIVIDQNVGVLASAVIKRLSEHRNGPDEKLCFDLPRLRLALQS